MGGYVNLAIRTKNGISKTLSYTGVISMGLRNPDLYSEDAANQEKAINRILALYNNCPEQKDPDCRQLSPYNYGLIVVDCSTRTILDMQVGDCIPIISLTTAATWDRGWEFLEDIFARGWLANGIYNWWGGEQVIPFPEPPFPSFEDFDAWIRNQYYSRFSMGGSIAYLHLKFVPPGWNFLSFDGYKESEDFKSKLIELGFDLSEDEIRFWEMWRKEQKEWAEDE